MDPQALLDYIAALYPEYWAWLQTKPNALRKVQNEAARLAPTATGAGHKVKADFVVFVEGLKSFTTFTTEGPGAGDDTEPGFEPDPGDVEPGPSDGDEPSDDTTNPDAQDIRDTIMEFLRLWGLENLAYFVEMAIAQGWSEAETLARLRQTPEYLAAFPENGLRAANGYGWISEGEILAYRDDARRLAANYLGIHDLNNNEIATLMGRNVSLSEWESNLQSYVTMLEWGPYVMAALEQELGFDVDDARLFAFFSPDIPTPELDRAYENALYRGRPAVLGFGIRPEEEADILRQYGIDPNQAFAGYQGIQGEMPRAERLAAIEGYINSGSAGSFPTSQDAMANVPFGLLFRAIQLRDPDAIEMLTQQIARESARFRAGGGPMRDSSGRVSGLLVPGQR